MKLHVQVMKEDILNGKPDDASCCPIALAIERLVPKCFEGGVEGIDRQAFEIRGPDGRRLVANAPEEAEEFIEAFDGDDDVEPFEFDVEFKEVEEVEEV